MLEDFLQYIQAERRYSPLTIRSYRHDIEIFAQWVGERVAGKFDPQQVTRTNIREWIVKRTDEDKMSATSVNRELSSLRAYFKFLRLRGVVDGDIFAGITSLRTSKRLPSYVTTAQIKRAVAPNEQTELARQTGHQSEIDEFVCVRTELIVMMLYTTGVRLAELIGINREDFSAEWTQLKVRGKGGKERVLPIIERTTHKISEYLDALSGSKICICDQNALFLSRKGKRISRTEGQRSVAQELERIGVQGKRSPHVLRHTLATHLLNEGADMREIQELLGHASLSSTQIYTHNSIKELERAYSRAHPRGARGADKEGEERG